MSCLFIGQKFTPALYRSSKNTDLGGPHKVKGGIAGTTLLTFCSGDKRWNVCNVPPLIPTSTFLHLGLTVTLIALENQVL